MNRNELAYALVRDKRIKHEKGGTYRVLSNGQVKIEGTWYDCFTYRDIKSGKTYTRRSDDFKKFKLI